MGSPTMQRFAVFRDPENPPESWRSWSAYTRDFNRAWRGFVGFYEGHGATRRERKADAIKRARADNCEPMDGIDRTPTPPAPADGIDPDAPIKCGTFGGVTIPPHIRARMDADRAAAKARATGAKCPRCGSSSPCVGPC